MKPEIGVLGAFTMAIGGAFKLYFLYKLLSSAPICLKTSVRLLKLLRYQAAAST